MEFIKLMAIGVVLGFTMVIPGLSTATVAVALNIYDRLINIIVPSLKKIFKAWQFWLPLAIGGLAGLVLASRVFTILFKNYSIPTYWFFIGVIIGCIPIVYSKTRKPPAADIKRRALPSFSSIICCIVGLTIMVFMTINKPEKGVTFYTELTLPLFLLLALSGMLAAAAMIIPGISGSFLLIVIGMYSTVLQAVNDLNILILIPVIAGAAAGILFCAALIRFLLAKAPQQTYGVVLGLVVGSILYLFPGGIGNGMVIFASILCLLGGFALSFFSSQGKTST